MEKRHFNYNIMPEMKDRWSPRAFDSTKDVSKDEIYAILEAARYAPSCFNEQPWTYIVGHNNKTYDKILSSLAPANSIWASKAPVLMVVMAKKAFAYNGSENRWHQFDAGTSWGYLSLEAQRRGLITHAMGGFNAEAINDLFELNNEYSIMAVVAVGYYGKKADLPKEIQEKEDPATRFEVKDFIIE